MMRFEERIEEKEREKERGRTVEIAQTVATQNRGNYTTPTIYQKSDGKENVQKWGLEGEELI